MDVARYRLKQDGLIVASVCGPTAEARAAMSNLYGFGHSTSTRCLAKNRHRRAPALLSRSPQLSTAAL